MLCACSGEQFRFEDQPGSPESLATRDFSASGLSSSRTRGGGGGSDWDSKLEESQVDEAESTLKEALSLNYEVLVSLSLILLLKKKKLKIISIDSFLILCYYLLGS